MIENSLSGNPFEIHSSSRFSGLALGFNNKCVIYSIPARPPHAAIPPCSRFRILGIIQGFEVSSSFAGSGGCRQVKGFLNLELAWICA